MLKNWYQIAKKLLKKYQNSKKIQLKRKVKREIHEAQTASIPKEIIPPPTTPYPTRLHLTTFLEQKFP